MNNHERKSTKTSNASALIERMLRNRLCTGCGTCAGVCQSGAIRMAIDRSGFFRPVFSSQFCSSCSLCVSCCPVLDFSERAAEVRIYSGTAARYTPALGYYSALYTASAVDQNLRFECSSGGFVTSLLLTLLNQGLIDRAVVVRQTAQGILGYTSDIVTSKEEVLGSRGSKYVPIQQADAIKTILKQDARFAFVGLPCHVAGLYRAMQTVAALRKRVRYTIALFCGGTTSLNATRYLLSLLEVPENQVKRIDYRGNGWPGTITIWSRDESCLTVPYRDIRAMGGVFSSIVFRPLSCAMCSDPFGRLADVSVGDAWLERFRQDKIGTSMVIARNTQLDSILHHARSSINIEYASEQDVLESNSNLVKAKCNNLGLKIRYFEKIHGQPYKAPSESFVSDADQTKGWNVMVYLIVRKYLSFLSKEGYFNKVPLLLIKLLKIINYLERWPRS